MSRREEVESEIRYADWSVGWQGHAHDMRTLARTLADEVDAERAIVTKILDLIAPHVDEFGNRQWWHYKNPQQIYNRALEIAGRKE